MPFRKLLRKPNVLAVDDQRANLIALEAALGDEFNVVFASSGAGAIEILEQRRDIDVILMDVQMPGMDGFEAATRIKAMESAEDIPIVFVTAVYHEDPFVTQGYKVGAVDYFSKPFDPGVMKVKVGIYAAFRQNVEMLRERARQLEESGELLQIGRKLSAALRSLEVGVIVTDLAGHILHSNDEVYALCKPAELGPLLKTLAGSRAPRSECLEVPRVDAPPRKILCRASPLRGVDGKMSGAVLIFEDLTERKSIEIELENRISRLVSAVTEPAPG